MTATLKLKTGEIVQFTAGGEFKRPLGTEFEQLFLIAYEAARPHQVEPFSYLPVFQAGEQLGYWTIEKLKHTDNVAGRVY